MNRVLVVDDKEENLYYLRALLEGHGFTVELARHGAEALTLARRHPPDACISDLLMPVMDGYTLLRYWKADARLRRAPFIVYTATYTEEEDERLARNLGADAFILKPAEPEEFLARLRETQARESTAQPTALAATAGDEKELLRVYSETLIRKLEEKTMQLEEVNRALQQDIERRGRIEKELRESEERFRATFEQAAAGIAHVDPEGRFLRVNAKLCEMTGYDRTELLQRTFRDLTMPEDRAEDDDARESMLNGRRAGYTTEKRYLRKDGGLFWGNLVVTLLRDDEGRPKYFISVIADVTERHALQEKFLRAQRLESIGTLAGGIAHDLNNLLTPVLMGTGLLRARCPDDASRRLVDSMERSARRGTELVKQVLSFARGVEGARVAVHLRHVVRELDEFVRTTFPKNIRFEATVPPDLWLVTGDPTQLNQVLLNLCVNARDAMPSGGLIRVSARNLEVDAQYAAMKRGLEPGRYVRLEVSDTGVGIPLEIQSRIFEPFFTTKGHGQGTGLGLSTILGIVRSHGGEVEVESAPGKGATFRVHLPARAEGGNGSAAPGSAAPFAPGPSGNGELILVVEDDPNVLAVTRQTLEANGYRVLAAEDGAVAIGLFAVQRASIDAVILDVMMPVMDGPALISALRRVEPNVHLIVTSGQPSHEARVTSLGIKRFLAKPYSSGTLLKALAAELQGEDSPATPGPAN